VSVQMPSASKFM